MRKRKTIDKITKKIKCPAITCRSANVQIISRGFFSTKYQCKKCGRVFKGQFKKPYIYWWGNIFTEYKKTKVEDSEFGEEMGTAIADKINEMIGSKYDSSKFEYYFSASPDDLKTE